MAAEKKVGAKNVDEDVRDVVARVKRLEEAILLLAATMGEAGLDGVHGREVARFQQIAEEMRKGTK